MDTLQEIVKKEYVENDSTLCFETTPPAKVFILSVLTFGIYDLILAYNWWKVLKQNFGYQVSPFWRGLFNVFTNFKLFPIFEKYFSSLEIKGAYFSGISCAIYYFMMQVADVRLTFKELSWEDAGSLTYDKTVIINIVSIILYMQCALVIAFLQNKINKTNIQYFPNAPKNPWKVSNIIWIIIFLIMNILTFLPE